MVMCVRDEEDFIGAHLAYHRAIGVSRAYIFADRCTDSTADIIKSFQWAKTFETSIDPSKALTIHLTRCADDALEMAMDEGFDWLIHIDADEFAFADNYPFGIFGRLFPFVRRMKCLPLLQRGNLLQMLARINKRTEMVLMRTREAMPIVTDTKLPFWKMHYFHDKALDGRNVLDPIDGKIKPLPWFGHARGKTIIRTTADVQSINAHQWTRNQGVTNPEKIPIPTEYRGFHFHFLFTSPEDWQKKYRKHYDFPDKWHTNKPVGFPKQSWKEASLKMSSEEVKQYFNKWLAMSSDELEKYLANGDVTQETLVEDVLRECRWITSV